ncbi:hypothetical protein J3Q64DRAFT_1315154 [Phycomyces blakesleeanus]|uniref:Uncharacterized protein n=1 Tax=Phycomyces blakesleeanus TaxID=4837 RepID=A0ABR3B8J0_PHYBL
MTDTSPAKPATAEPETSIASKNPCLVSKESPAQMPLPSPTMSTGTVAHVSHKKPTRHHVKRKSGGRVHVTKLAPMARAHSSTAVHTDTEIDGDHDNERKPMRRSQSQRSLNRLSSLDRKGGLVPMTKSKPQPSPSPPTTPPPPQQQQQQQQQQPEPEPEPEPETQQERQIQPSSPQQQQQLLQPLQKKQQQSQRPQQQRHISGGNPGFTVSRNAPAAPVEQTFNAVANNLVVPEKASTTTNATAATVVIDPRKKPLLRSQFVEEEEAPTRPRAHMSNVASAASSQPAGMTRTQQKLMLQRQHTLVDDENNLAHPRNMIRLTRELERMGREYRCVRRYQDPMMDSLKRCTFSQSAVTSSTAPTASQSDSITSSSTSPRPHHALRRQLLTLKTPAQSAQNSSRQNARWSAGAFLDRMLNH